MILSEKSATFPDHAQDEARMTLEEYNSFCASLSSTTHVVQWGGAHVWKVGGKVFAIAGWSEGDSLAVTFKCSDIAYDILREQPGLRPAPYLASRGMKWIQRRSGESMDDEALRDYLRESQRLVALKLPRKIRSELGLPAK
jgi:predicted DNA-binding protein (MmcQ/YjbR family)